MGRLSASEDNVGNISLTAKQFSGYYYEYILKGKRHGRNGPNRPCWRGVPVDKFPQDLLMYAQVIFKRKPDYIIETGTKFGGSGLFFADMIMLCGGKKVFSIDIASRERQSHPFLEYIAGSSTNPSIVERIKSEISGSVMVSLDSDHNRKHVLNEMNLYGPMVTRGQYMVVEDAYVRAWRPYDPFIAIEEFLKTHKEFRRYDLEKQFLLAITKGGWLRRIR